jgi:hypothetical protein
VGSSPRSSTTTSISLHGDVFRACVLATQLTVENGELLFEAEVEYGEFVLE